MSPQPGLGTPHFPPAPPPPNATPRSRAPPRSIARLCGGLKAGRLNEPYLADLESKDNIFPDIDYRLYAT